MLVAILIRMIDDKEWLVSFFNLQQIEGTPPADLGDYWNAILHHKSTYYLAAVLLVLLLVGATVAARMCYFLCSGCRNDAPADCRVCYICPSHSPHDTYIAMQGVDSCCECANDCSYFCARCCDGGECPACEFNHQSCSECHCGQVECGNDAGGCAAICLGAIIIVAVAFILVGAIVAFMAVVTWLHKV